MDVNPDASTAAKTPSMRYWALCLVLILLIGILDSSNRLGEIECSWIAIADGWIAIAGYW